jgi:hypothetical protein
LAAVASLLAPIRGLSATRSKERLEIINTVITTAAVFVGAVWVWDEFSRERQGIPQLTTTQTIASFPLPDDQVLLDPATAGKS